MKTPPPRPLVTCGVAVALGLGVLVLFLRAPAPARSAIPAATEHTANPASSTNSPPRSHSTPTASPAPHTSAPSLAARLRAAQAEFTADATAPERRVELAAELNRLTADLARARGVPLLTVDGARLSHFDGEQPVYIRDHNANAALSTAATHIRSTSPYNVTGDGVVIGLWESGGLPRATHNDLTGRVTLGDTGSTSLHATHVAGTLIGDGTTSASVLGMAPAATLDAYILDSSTDHYAEAGAIAATAEGDGTKIYLSNHSYGTATGWYLDALGNHSWYGTFSDDGDPDNDQVKAYGQYGFEARTLDDLANDYPYLLMFFSAGNDRGYAPPSTGGTWYLNGNTGSAYTYDPATHPRDNEDWMVDGSVTGYGTISPQSSAKNVLSIGAVADAVSGGSRSTAAAAMSDFSSYGPTDDGRIKPDLVANGVSVKSLSNSSNSATTTTSGTSMSAPNAAGTAALLVEYFGDKFPGQSLRSSLLKALLIHTADDLGNPGPDYRHGWGLINAQAAADIIKESAANSAQNRLLDGQLSPTDASDAFTFTYDGSGELRVTLAWNDPKGSSTSNHDQRTATLKHDLNLTVTGPDGTHYPYVMPWVGDWSDAKLNDPATTGVNTVDNVEQVYLSAPAAGTYTITVNHAGSLSGDQIYSLVLTGGDFGSEAPDGGADLAYDRVSGFGTIEPFNVHTRFSSAHETTYTLTVDDSAVVTAAIDAEGVLIITEAGVGTTQIHVTATNDLGQTDTVTITVNVAGNVIYVNAANTGGTHNGLTWATAYDELTDALAAASSGQQIWVAAGIYYPSPPEANPTAGDQVIAFNLPGDVPLYGGFAGDETSLAQRDPDTHLSILSGDLDRNDLNRADGITDLASEIVGNNSWLLVIAASDDDDFRLDGFVLTAAATHSALSGIDYGAAMLIQTGCANGTVANCRFLGFSAEGVGGAVHIKGTGTTFENCSFSGISAGGDGGALYATRAVTLTDCVFRSNTAAGDGGALHLQGATHVLRRCVFQGNVSQGDGGAISFSAGGAGVLTNCLVTGNSAAGANSRGGALVADTAAFVTVTNSTLCSNFSTLAGGALALAGDSDLRFDNSLAWANAVAGDASHANAFSYVADPAASSLLSSASLTQGAVDPLLTTVPAASSTGTLAGDFRLLAGSPAIEAGDNSLALDASGTLAGLAGDEATDLAGDARLHDGDYDGTPTLDLGCYESDQPAIIAPLADVTLNFATGASSAAFDLDDHFGGTGLTFVVSVSSADLLATLDEENVLHLALTDEFLNDGTYTVTITATDAEGRTLQQTFTVTFALTRLYVSTSATGAATGRTWDDAFPELRDALAVASADDEIWVAEGIYKPSASSATAQFLTLDGLAIRGGFSGDETDLDEADPAAHLTILSGDIDGDDTVDAHGITLGYLDHGPGGGNTSVPLVSIPANTSATLSGLVICGAASSGIQTNSGATLVLTDCVVRGNQRTGDGGGLNALGSTHTISDTRFLQNYASAHGGAIRNGATTSTMTLDRCVLAGNASGSNGGAYAVKGGGSGNRNIRLRDCLLTGNSAANDGGAIHSWVGGTTMYLTNCTLAANHAAGEGGSIFWLYGVGVIANNTLVWGNSSAPAIKTENFATATWKYCLIEGSDGSAAWDATELGTDGGNNLDADPLFVSLPDAASAPTLDGDFTFDITSPAFDAGSDSLSTSSVDLVGQARVRYAAIDLGAYENFTYILPTFDLDHDTVTVFEDRGAHTQTGFAINLSANDEGQSPTGFTVTTDNDALFSVAPAIDLDGTLTFTPAPNAYGSVTVTVVLHDDGPSANASLPLTFPLIIVPDSDAPTDVTLDNNTVADGDTFVGTVTATEPFGQPITWSIVVYEDGQAFSIDSTSGELSFVRPPNFDSPIDGDENNTYLVAVRATGSDGVQIEVFTITVTADPLANFRAQYDLAEDGSDDALDASGNGVANLLYYAFGLGDPSAADIDRDRLPTFSTGTAADTVTFSYVRPAVDDSGLSITVETSADLATWLTPLAVGSDYLPLDEQTEDLGDGYERITQTYELHAAESRRFYRLTVSTGPDL